MRIGVYVRCKDEQNIIEFIEHYYNLGFDFIVFLDHNSKKPIQEVIIDKKYENKYYILRTEGSMRELNCGVFFKNNILPILEKYMDYCLYVDMDEYIVIKKFNNIKDAIETYMPFDMLKINWLGFGDNNIDYIEDISNIKKIFTRSAPKLDKHVKSLAKVSSINTCNTEISPHVFCLKNNSIIKNVKNEISDIGPFEYNTIKYELSDIDIYLAHYMVQGKNNFLIRRYGAYGYNMHRMKGMNYDDKVCFGNLIEQNIESLIKVYRNRKLFDEYFNIEHPLHKYKELINNIIFYALLGYNKNHIVNNDLV